MFNLYDAIKSDPATKKIKVHDLLFAEYTCLETEKKIRLWSQHNYFVYVLSGKKKWFSIENEYLVEAGQSLFIKKGAHLAYQYFDDDFCALLLFLPDSFIRQALNQNQADTGGSEFGIPNGDAILRIDLNKVLTTYFHSVLAYFEDSSAPSKDLLELKFKELILNLASDSSNQATGNYLRWIGKSSETSIRSVMEANFAYNMNLEEYARLCNRSLSTFKRDFRKLYDTSPGKWLTQKRLSYGKYLLESTDKNVNEISFESGFQNVSHFVRAFKKKYGHTPTHYSHA